MSETDSDASLPLEECVVCGDEFPRIELIDFNCEKDHAYCVSCLQDLYKASFIYEDSFPTHCCGSRVPLEQHADFLTPDIIQTYKQRALEWAPGPRVYCHNTACGGVRLVEGSVIIDGKVTCEKCGLATCVECQEAAHDGECRVDDSKLALMELAKEKGWQACPKCKRLIEREDGCADMICACSAKFCYDCGELTEECTCE